MAFKLGNTAAAFAVGVVSAARGYLGSALAFGSAPSVAGASSSSSSTTYYCIEDLSSSSSSTTMYYCIDDNSSSSSSSAGGNDVPLGPFADGYYLGCPTYTFSFTNPSFAYYNGTYRPWGTMSNDSWSYNTSPQRWLKVANGEIVPGPEVVYDSGCWQFYDGGSYNMGPFSFVSAGPGVVLPTTGWKEYCGQIDSSCDDVTVTVTQGLCSGYILEFPF